MIVFTSVYSLAELNKFHYFIKFSIPVKYTRKEIMSRTKDGRKGDGDFILCIYCARP